MSPKANADRRLLDDMCDQVFACLNSGEVMRFIELLAAKSQYMLQKQSHVPVTLKPSQFVYITPLLNKREEHRIQSTELRDFAISQAAAYTRDMYASIAEQTIEFQQLIPHLTSAEEVEYGRALYAASAEISQRAKDDFNTCFRERKEAMKRQLQVEMEHKWRSNGGSAGDGTSDGEVTKAMPSTIGDTVPRERRQVSLQVASTVTDKNKKEVSPHQLEAEDNRKHKPDPNPDPRPNPIDGVQKRVIEEYSRLEASITPSPPPASRFMPKKFKVYIDASDNSFKIQET
ncbi:hypothetical protein AMATHDRAFT_49924 [Amanita thiersii Skay4041]|uniref:Uncharacterized protein n=1 Tax=Amanita thiersii Skay4041 TaxID=703135 RepID=A0A2A9NA92_9AGAR|nr:hypothetical protein AMATHDRAFT_49924 [Amanita thiersii Skay4041]